MRSTAFTLFLLITATLVCGVLGWRLSEGNLNAIFGVPPVPLGQPLYSNFLPDEVEKMSISGNGANAEFVKTPSGWKYAHAPHDRMDPRAAINIINFTLGLRVEDHAPEDEIDDHQAGFGENTIRVHLETADGRTLARYRIGGRSPWFGQDPETQASVATVFIHPRERGRRDHIYTCTGDIIRIFRDGLRHLRDPRPFHFHPQFLSRIRIRTPGGSLTLAHDTPQAAWRIVSPMDLPTDSDVVTKSLISGLYDFAAAEVLDRSDVILPSNGDAARSIQIALQTFGSEDETVLEIYPPTTPEARDSYATVSDRPQTVFSLPIKPEAGLISLADLPLTVNDLRNPKLLPNLNLEAIKAISIESATATSIVISRDERRSWIATIGNTVQPANRQHLAKLLEVLMSTSATAFVTDSATDLSPWGLDHPFLRLRLLAIDNQSIELAFSMDLNGRIFFNRTGTPTVMQVDPSILSSISVVPHEWREARLLSVSKVDLKSIEVIRPPEEPLFLTYGFIREEWTATRAGEDLSADVDPFKANYFLGILEKLDVQQWLSVNDPDAATALAEPTLILRIVENEIDDFGDTTGEVIRTLQFAPVPGVSASRNYYGRLSGEPHPFIIDQTTYLNLAEDLLDSR